MTTEIAVVNRLGIALAADSAVTISGDNKSKVFDTGDKLFELNDRHPVGVMINGNMDLLGVPWEIILKDFRSYAHGNVERSIKDWMQCLLDYVARHKAFSVNAERSYITGVAIEEFSLLKQAVSTELFQSTNIAAKVDIGQLVEREAKKRREIYAKKDKAESLKDLSPDDVRKKYVRLLNGLITRNFAPVEIPVRRRMELRRLVVDALLSGEQSNFTTGLIVAGYGDGDMFPSLAIAEVEGSVAGVLKYSHGNAFSIDRTKNPGRVVSFAQTDVVDRILSGTDFRFIAKSAEYIKTAIGKSSSLIAELLTKAGVEDAVARGVFTDMANGISNEYRQGFAKDARAEFEGDFNEMVALMPKQEIIELAEALISITAIERKASSDQATVGGPVDVAFITKHEGFVWIKRKHYFEAGLNPRYFWRKFQPAGKQESPDEQNYE